MDGQRDERPDPELLLKQNFPRESDKARGRLKIFFGYAAGVEMCIRDSDRALTNEEREQSLDSMIRCALELAAEAAEAAEEAGTADRILAPGYTA